MPTAVRPYRPDDLDAVADLYRRAYRGDLARRRQAFQWIQEGNPQRDPDVAYLLYRDADRVDGYLGLMPVRLYVGGDPLAAAYCQEALVDPEVRGRGIATTLFEVGNRTPRPMMSLWHNERIVSLLGKTGWTRVGPLPTIRRIYRLDRLAASRVGPRALRAIVGLVASGHRLLQRATPPVPGEYVIEKVTHFGPEFDDLFQVAASQLRVIADRGRDTLDWKYSSVPHQHYHIAAVRRGGHLCAYGVLRVQQDPNGIRKGLIVDVLGDPSMPGAMDALAVHADRYFREERADLAAGVISPTRFRRSFQTVGFRRVAPTATSWLWIRNQGFVPGSARELERIENWYLTLGDSDRDMW